MRNAKEGESLKDAMYSGLDVSDDFKRAYGKDLDKYADKYEGIKKESRDAKISVKDFNDEVVKGGKEAVTKTIPINRKMLLKKVTKLLVIISRQIVPCKKLLLGLKTMKKDI